MGGIIVMFLVNFNKRHSFYGLIIILFFMFTCPCEAAAEELIRKGETLNLKKCVEIALKKHPQIVSAINTLDVNKSRVGQALAGYYPQLNLSTGLSRNASPLQPDQYNQYSQSLILTQNIYDFSRTGTKVDIQKLNLEAARADLNMVFLNIIMGVKQAYYELLRAKRARTINVETIGQFEQHLETARGLYEAGSKPMFDVTKAEVDLSNARVNLLKAENAIIIARVNLNNAMGMPEAPPYDLEEDVVYQKNTVDLNESLKKAYLMRPDLRSLIFKKEAAQKSILLARKDFLPTLSGSAGYGWSGEEYPLERGWNIGANLNFNLFSGFLTKNQVGEAMASFEVSRAVEDTLRQTIRLDVEQAYANLQTAEKSIAAAEVTLRQAEENQKLAQGRYAAGVGSPLEVTDALVAYGNARLTLSGAIYDHKEAEASLQKAMGEGAE
jgi:outer membrane protein TolC